LLDEVGMVIGSTDLHACTVSEDCVDRKTSQMLCRELVSGRE
jgi:hypothetical protein